MLSPHQIRSKSEFTLCAKCVTPLGIDATRAAIPEGGSAFLLAINGCFTTFYFKPGYSLILRFGYCIVFGDILEQCLGFAVQMSLHFTLEASVFA